MLMLAWLNLLFYHRESLKHPRCWLYIHCPKNNLNPFIKSEPATAGADATAYGWFPGQLLYTVYTDVNKCRVYIRVQWFFDFQNKRYTVVLNYLRSPNPKYDPLKLCFSICANRLKVWLFSSYILRIWISRQQCRQSNHSRQTGKGSARFSREIPAIVIVL